METHFVKTGDINLLCEKDFLPTSSFDSSDDDAPQPLKSSSTFSSRMVANSSGLEIKLSETRKLDVRIKCGNLIPVHNTPSFPFPS